MESQTNRSVDVLGITDSTELERLQFVSTITPLNLEDAVILLKLNECIKVKNNQASLLSTFQVREADVIVNDIVKRHNG